MKNKFFLTISLLFTLVQFGWAQTITVGDVQQALYVVQQNSMVTNQRYQQAQWQGNVYEMQACQTADKFHQFFQMLLGEVMRQPYCLQDAQNQYELGQAWQEYSYRVSNNDWNLSWGLPTRGTTNQQAGTYASSGYSPSTYSSNSYAERSRASDANHKAFIDNIWDESPYQNPDTGSVYKVDTGIDNPHLVNDDGSTTELSPYSY